MDIKEPNYKAEAEYLQILESLDQNKLSEAFEKCYELIEKYPDFAKAYFSLGWLYFHKIGDYQKGLEMYNKCLELDLNIVKFTTSFIYILSTLERFDDLEKYLKKAIDLPGIDKYVVYYEYGAMYELKKDFDKAKEFYKKALEYDLKENATNIYEAHIQRCENKKRLLENKL